MLLTDLIHPEINRVLAAAGHHATVLIADANYPASTKRGPNATVVSLGLVVGVPTCDQVLDAVLAAVPIESVRTMQTETDGPHALPGDPPVWDDYRETLRRRCPTLVLEPTEKWQFYDAVATVDHCLTIRTGDTSPYANVLLSIGVRKG